MSTRSSWYGDRAKRQAREAAADGLADAADFILRKSQPRVPVSPYAGGGFLKATGQTDVDRDGLVAAISYDGPADNPGMPVYVHERMDLKHETGSAKFLETPMLDNKREAREMVGKQIRRALKS